MNCAVFTNPHLNSRDCRFIGCSSGSGGSLLTPTPDSCLVSLINYHHRQKYFLIKNVRGKKRAVTNMKNNSFDLFQNECIRLYESFHTGTHSAAPHMTLAVAIFFCSAFMSWIKWLASTTSTTDAFIQRKFESFTAFELQAELGFFRSLSLSSLILWFRLIVRG